MSTGYGYDYENRLANISYPDSTTSQYVYDGVGKRVQTRENGTVTNYFYDGLNSVIEKNGNGETVASYVRGLSYGGGIGGIILQSSAAGTAYYLYDGIGTVTGMTDATGTLTQSYQYDAYGNFLTPLAPSPYGYSTKEYSAKSGLIYFGARYYDPRVGRFITPDPWTWAPDDPRILNNPEFFLRKEVILWGGARYPLLFNRYSYCLNNPLNRMDYWGNQGVLGPYTAEIAEDMADLLDERIEQSNDREAIKERGEQNRGIYGGLYYENLDQRGDIEKAEEKIRKNPLPYLKIDRHEPRLPKPPKPSPKPPIADPGKNKEMLKGLLNAF